MAETVRSLSAANLSPVFAFLYDEYWCPFLKLHHLYDALLGGRYMWLPAFWVWDVDPKKSESGWKPHRDRGRKSLFDDGAPKALTTWIPLSPATPLNGCIYIVPASHDPIYATEEELNWKAHLEYSSIRALPDHAIWSANLVTSGGLLFTGKETGEFIALDIEDGKQVWQFQTGSGINAQPITYTHNGKQYITVLSGIGGLWWNLAREQLKDKVPQGGSVWTFALVD